MSPDDAREPASGLRLGGGSGPPRVVGLRERVGQFVRAVRDRDESLAAEAVLELSRLRRLFAPLAFGAVSPSCPSVVHRHSMGAPTPAAPHSHSGLRFRNRLTGALRAWEKRGTASHGGCRESARKRSRGANVSIRGVGCRLTHPRCRCVELWDDPFQIAHTPDLRESPSTAAKWLRGPPLRFLGRPIYAPSWRKEQPFSSRFGSACVGRPHP